jgi:homoserine kinase
LALVEEDHPDNLAAALHGAFTIAWLEADGLGDCVRMDVHPDVRPVVFVPDAEVATKKARALLPLAVAFPDASANIARAALLVHSLTTDPGRLMPATEDRLHQQARAKVYPDSVSLVASLRAAGMPAVISGAGPSVLAFGSVEDASVVLDGGEGWRVSQVAISTFGAREVPIPPLP